LKKKESREIGLIISLLKKATLFMVMVDPLFQYSITPLLQSFEGVL